MMNESEFYMWRAVFAFAMADRTMTPGELELLNDYRSDARFSPEQLQVLRDDFLYPQDVEALYRNVTDPEHRHRFCAMARALAWCDGDLSRQDEIILKRISCLGGDDALARSRTHPDLGEYHDLYARNDMLGFLKTPHIVELRA